MQQFEEFILNGLYWQIAFRDFTLILGAGPQFHLHTVSRQSALTVTENSVLTVSIFDCFSEEFLLQLMHIFCNEGFCAHRISTELR